MAHRADTRGVGHREACGWDRVECVRSFVLKCVSKIKGFVIAMIAETTAGGDDFLESRGLLESWGLKGQAKLQNRFT